MMSLLIAAAPAPPAAAALTASGGLAIAVVAAVFVVLMVRRSTPVELLFVAGLVVATLGGAISTDKALAGFSSGPVLLIGALFAAAAGLRTTGALDWIGGKLLGSATTERAALWRLTLVAPMSAFVLNTPLVAMLAPVVIDWCRQRKVSPSRLLMPLSFLTILGGVCTVIGTSTTLVCNAQIASERERLSAQMAEAQVESPRDLAEFYRNAREIELLEIGYAGVPLALLGIGYLLWLAPRRLPKRADLIDNLGDHRREYLVEMMVQPGCALVGKTVELAGLRQLPGLFLIEISRGQEVITPVTPSDVIQAHDRMVFTGVVGTIADLERIPGLVPAADITYEFRPAERTKRQLAEAVLSRTSPVIGRTVREANFRQRYNSAIVAVHRGGERLGRKIGDIRLQPGDTLLLQARSGFVETYRNSRDFFLVSEVGGSSARRHDRAIVAAGLFVGLLVWLVAASVNVANPDAPAWLTRSAQPIAALAAVILMIATRCLSTSQARQAVDLQVLITIAAAIGLGNALNDSGAAHWLANKVVTTAEMAPLTTDALPWLLLAAVYLLSMLMTECITNAAVATIMIPISIGIAQQADVSPRPFLMAVAVAASLSFATPIGYQTNLMVMGPGGYQPRDFLRTGGPLAALVALAAVPLIGWIWRF